VRPSVPGHRRKLLTSLAIVIVIATGAGLATAFFDEVLALRAELAEWEAVHADADFSDVLEQLDDLAGTTFNDVQDSAWYAPYVTTLSEWGIVSGYRDERGRTTGQFGPSNPVTVAEILKMAAGAARIDPSSCPAPVARGDAESHWAAAYVGCAESRSARVVASGYASPLDRPATRAEVLAVMHDLFSDDVPPLTAAFPDAAGHPFEADIAYASLLHVVSGDTDAAGHPTGTFRPNDPVNRAEAAKILVLRIKQQAAKELALVSKEL
jgi:hypothetical protein